MSNDSTTPLPDDPAALIGMWDRVVGDHVEESSPHMSSETPASQPASEPPKFARREVLPLNSGNKRIKPGETCVITVRPQRPQFQPERLFISGFEPRSEPTSLEIAPMPKRPWWKFWARRPDPQVHQLTLAIAALHSEISAIRAGGARSTGASDWDVQDISIGNKSQFAQAGAIPGDIFSNLSIDSFVHFDTVKPGMDVCIGVTYRGSVKDGVVFSGGMLGTSSVDYQN